MESADFSHKIYVSVKDDRGEELNKELYELDFDYNTVYVYVKPFGCTSDDTDLLRKIRDIASEKCPEFLPHLQDLELQLALEPLRNC